MRINTNIPAMQTAAFLNKNGKALTISTNKLSTGLRINSAKDDASGLAVANKLKVQAGALELASRNSLDGVSLIQTAEGALNEVHSIMQRMRELAVQAANGVYESDDRAKIQYEIESLVEEIDGISARTEFNKIKLIGGEAGRMGFSSEYKAVGVTYVSDTVPAGTLKYEVVAIGTPANTKIDIPNRIPNDGTITINGEKIEVTAGQTRTDVIEAIRDTCDIIGAEVRTTTDGIYITSKLAGSMEYIDFKVSSPLDADVKPASPYSSYSKGTDAQINYVDFEDVTGTSEAGFNAAKTVYVEGNRVEVTSSNGQKIYLDLKVAVKQDKVTESVFFEFNGDSYVNIYDENNPATLLGGDLPLEAEVKNYGPLVLQIGPNKDMEMEISIPKLDAKAMRLDELNYQTIDSATKAISIMDKAISEISVVRGKLGAYQNRLEHTILNLDATYVNIEAARSRIEDTNMATEMTNYTKYNVLNQSGLSILAQANQRPQQILSILQ